MSECKYPLLDSIESPDHIKNMSYNELGVLANEVRCRIIDVLSKTGGHLASNFGTVELTLALHKVFNSPLDKLIWDVSHQTYTHKLLTGRNSRMETIRQFKGLSGFSNPKESPYDHFFCGHAGAALSLSLGVAKKRDLCGGDEYVIPIIGDASLTCGMSLEALNNISRGLKRFIIILNDNEMSISKNVGAITHILSRILSNPTTTRIHQEVDNLLAKVPGLGAVLSKQGHKISESLKNLFSPAVFFEHFGLSYIGPIDGHNIKSVVDALEGVKNSNWPVILHVMTEKGHGLTEAQDNPITWHGAKPFCTTTYKFHSSASSRLTFPKIFGNQILQMAKNDEDIVVVTPAMSCGSSLDPMMEAFPERCIDVGIAESHAVTFSGGIGYERKKKVFTCIYSTFLQRGFDNIFHDVCLQEIPVVFAIDRAGTAGGDGHTHNGVYDISFLNAMPNMVITQPRNGRVLKELMLSAHEWGRPAAIRYPNLPTDEEEETTLQSRALGKGELLQKGEMILILALGHMVETAMEVSKLLEEEGIKPTIVDPVFVKPLDGELLYGLLTNHHYLVTIEDHSAVSGFGSIVNHYMATQNFNSHQVLNIGVPETFVAQGTHALLYDEIGLSPAKIFARIKDNLPLESIKVKASETSEVAS